MYGFQPQSPHRMSVSRSDTTLNRNHTPLNYQSRTFRIGIGIHRNILLKTSGTPYCIISHFYLPAVSRSYRLHRKFRTSTPARCRRTSYNQWRIPRIHKRKNTTYTPQFFRKRTEIMRCLPKRYFSRLLCINSGNEQNCK